MSVLLIFFVLFVCLIVCLPILSKFKSILKFTSILQNFKGSTINLTSKYFQCKFKKKKNDDAFKNI